MRMLFKKKKIDNHGCQTCDSKWIRLIKITNFNNNLSKIFLI